MVFASREGVTPVHVNWHLPGPPTPRIRINVPPGDRLKIGAFPSVVLVHDDPRFGRDASAALARFGHTAHVFLDPLRAYDQLIDASPRLLITRVRFVGRMIHGITLARMAIYRDPQLSILFVAPQEFSDATRRLGAFLPLPVTAEELAAAAAKLLRHA